MVYSINFHGGQEAEFDNGATVRVLILSLAHNICLKKGCIVDWKNSEI